MSSTHSFTNKSKSPCSHKRQRGKWIKAYYAQKYVATVTWGMFLLHVYCYPTAILQLVGNNSTREQ